MFIGKPPDQRDEIGLLARTHNSKGFKGSVQWKLQLEPEGAPTTIGGSLSHRPNTRCCCEKHKSNGVEF